MNTAPIFSKVWSFCTTLRDDGVGHGNHPDQLTCPISLQRADECAKPPCRRDVGIPEWCDRSGLTGRRSAEPEASA